MTRKPDTIGYKEFNRLTDHSDINHDPLPSQVLFDDENINQLEETLMGMEYELEDPEELMDEDELAELEDEEDNEVALELSEEDLMDDLDEDDINADATDEVDESAQFEGRPGF